MVPDPPDDDAPDADATVGVASGGRGRGQGRGLKRPAAATDGAPLKRPAAHDGAPLKRPAADDSKAPPMPDLSLAKIPSEKYMGSTIYTDKRNKRLRAIIKPGVYGSEKQMGWNYWGAPQKAWVEALRLIRQDRGV